LRLVNSKITGASLALDGLFSGCVPGIGRSVVVGDPVGEIVVDVSIGGAIVGIVVGIDTGALQLLNKNNRLLICRIRFFVFIFPVVSVVGPPANLKQIGAKWFEPILSQ